MLSTARRAGAEQCSFLSTPKFEANPDIAGIGVILSFVITACLVFAIVVLAYYFVQTSYNAGTITRLDQLVATTAQDLVAYLAKPFSRRSPTVEKLSRMSEAITDSNLLYRILLSFSDQQMITGFAILTVALVQMKSITEYHFAIVQSLAVLSFIIHDTTALILRDSVVQRRMTRTWRGIAIISTMLITIVVQIPTGHTYWLRDYGVPVKCIWTSMQGNYNPVSGFFWAMIVYVTVLLGQALHTLSVYFPQIAGGLLDNIVTRILWSRSIEALLFPRKVYMARVKHPTGNFLNRSLTSLAKFTAISIFVFAELFGSRGFLLLVHWTNMLFTISYTFFLRSTAIDLGREGNEDEWGFGQAVPMFLLIIPIATVVETAYDAFKKRHGMSARHDHRLDHERVPTAELLPSDVPDENTSYTVYWHNQAGSSALSWISAVEVTSASGTDIGMPLQPMGNASHSTTSQIFHPEAEAWTKVSVFHSGKNTRSARAGYYFGASTFITTAEGHSRIGGTDADWEMENDLYCRRGFRIAMLGVLVVLFCLLTSLGGGLMSLVQ